MGSDTVCADTYARLRVAFDPGHDRESPGTSHNGIVEYALTSQIAEYLDAYSRCGPTTTTMITREAGEVISYSDRAKRCKNFGAEIVYCLHVNAMPDSAPARGLITFYAAGDKRGREVASVLSRCAPSALLRIQPSYFEAKRGDWTHNANNVIQAYRALGLCAVLVELGFATDRRDASTLVSEWIRPQLAAMIACGNSHAVEVPL